MTYSRMVELIAKRTGVPERVVRMVLGTQNDIMRACLIRQESVHFPRLLKIHSEPRSYKVPENNLDGLVVDAKGDFLISSWAGTCVYRVSKDGAKTTVALPDLKDAADVGYDAKRNLLLIPLFSDHQLLIVAVE